MRWMQNRLRPSPGSRLRSSRRALMLSAYRVLAAQFPPLDMARKDGLLCAGGDLSPARLLAAYSLGIFPWYEQGLPVLWWSPDPRCILPLESFRLPGRSRRALRQKAFTITLDAAFGRVIRACAAPRKKSSGTWIIPEVIRAYSRLFDLGYAHSVEVWDGENLAGGLYGVALGKAFFGESMFHGVPEASRAALAALVSLLKFRGVTLLDCQQETPHIMQMGGCMIPRPRFLTLLQEALEPAAGEKTQAFPWPPWERTYAYSADSGSWAAKS